MLPSDGTALSITIDTTNAFLDDIVPDLCNARGDLLLGSALVLECREAQQWCGVGFTAPVWVSGRP